MPRPKTRTPELRAHVLKTAIGTLAREGIVGFTTRKVAEDAGTSTPAVYELFGDKAGLVREVFYEGFRILEASLHIERETGDPRVDLVRYIEALRAFIRASPVLGEVMFARPFTEFEPGPVDPDIEACPRAAVMRILLARVQACIEAEQIDGDPTDIAHVLLSLTQGLAATEAAGWLGHSTALIERRWELAIGSLVTGMAAKRPASHARGRAKTTRRRGAS